MLGEKPGSTEGLRQRGPLEILAARFPFSDPVHVTGTALNGDILWDVAKKVQYLTETASGGIVVLYGTARSGKTSILQSLSLPTCFLDCRHLALTPTAAATRERIPRSAKEKIIILDEIATLGIGEQEKLLIQFLGENKTILTVMHLGHEQSLPDFRSMGKKLHHPIYVVNMVSKDSPAGLQKRLRHWIEATKQDAIDTRSGGNSQVTAAIEAILFEESALAAVGEITAYRPWEVNCFLRDFLPSLPAETQAITRAMVTGFFENSNFRRNYLVSAATDYHWHLLADLLSKKEQKAIKMIGRGLPLDRGLGEKTLVRLMEATGLGYITSDQNGFSIKGKWLARDWKPWI